MRKRLEKRKMNRDRKISGRKSVTNIKRQGREKQRRAEIEREVRKKKKQMKPVERDGGRDGGDCWLKTWLMFYNE